VNLLLESATVEVYREDGAEPGRMQMREEKAFWHQLVLEKNRSKANRLGLIFCHEEVLRKLHYQEVRPTPAEAALVCLPDGY
jgi:hypothetical protein